MELNPTLCLLQQSVYAVAGLPRVRDNSLEVAANPVSTCCWLDALNWRPMNTLNKVRIRAAAVSAQNSRYAA